MKYLTNYVPQEKGGMSAGYVVVEDNGVLKAQKLSFDGTTPQFDGVAEEITGVGIFETGLDEPAYNGGGTGGTAKYYKCVSVDTANKTWTGYELVLQDGVYVVSETLTDNLNYTFVTPDVGGYYSADALIKVADFYTGLPNNGLIFYASLATDTSITESGHTLIKSGSPTFTEDEWGMSCVEIKSDSYLYFDQSILPMNAESRSFSFWARVENYSTSDPFLCFGYGGSGDCRMCTICIPESNKLIIDFYNYNMSSSEIDVYKWHHFFISYDSSTSSARMYVDGTLCASSNDLVLRTVDGYDGYAFIGESPEPNYGVSTIGYLAACRVYNRALSQAEIAALANEFTPTAEDAPDLPDDELVGTPRGTRLMLRHIDLDPVWEEEFVQDDIDATGTARTWTNVNPQGFDRIMYNSDYGGWNVFSNYGDPLYAGADREDPWGTDGFDGLAEIVVIE